MAARAWFAPLAFATLAALALAAVAGGRLDAAPQILQKHAHAKKEGSTVELATSDREIDEQIGKARTTHRLLLGLRAGFGTPARIVLLAVGLFLLCRYVGGKPTLIACLTVAAYGALPGALRSLLGTVVAYRSASLVPSEVEGLVAGAPALFPGSVWARVFEGVDGFTLWSLALIGFGVAAAAGLSRTRAFAATSFGFSLYLMVSNLILGSSPGPK